MKKENVTHRGIIKSIGPHSLTILTDDECSCEGCAITALCNKDSEAQHELLTIDIPSSKGYAPGQRVEITASSASTLRATLWALIVPTLIFIVAVLGSRLLWPAVGGWALAIGLGALAIYDGGLYVFRRSLSKAIVWKVNLI